MNIIKNILFTLLGIISLWLPVSPVAYGQNNFIAVSVPPQKFIVENIAGTNWNTVVVIDKGQDPHIYEPTPRKLEEIIKCRLYLSIGMPFEKMIVQKLSKITVAMEVLNMYGAENDHEHEHNDHCNHVSDLDPHSWMSPDELSRQAAAFTEKLSQIDPQNSEIYRTRLLEFKNQMVSLKTEIEELLKNSGTTIVAVYHPAWGHFAKSFGLEQVAIEVNGTTPGAKHLSEITAKLRDSNVQVMLVQNMAELRRAKPFAEKTGLSISIVNPLDDNPAITIRRSAELIK